MEEDRDFNKNILIAVDESPSARRAVEYVARMVGGLPDFKATILHIIPEPEEDYFPDPEGKERWLAGYREKTDRMLGEYREILLRGGFSESQVSVKSQLRFCPSMAECILSEGDDEVYDTIVVGRHGLSRSEEFLFGSISSKIVYHARNLTVWVVK